MDFRTLTKDEISKLNEGHPPIVFGLDCEEAIRGLIANIELLERELAAEKALADELHEDLVHSGISMNPTILKYRKARGL